MLELENFKMGLKWTVDRSQRQNNEGKIIMIIITKEVYSVTVLQKCLQGRPASGAKQPKYSTHFCDLVNCFFPVFNLVMRFVNY